MFKKLTVQYFNLFNSKNHIKLSEMLSEDVFLEDWEVVCHGKAKVVTSIQELFKSVDEIMVKPLRMYGEGSTIISELEIIINNTSRLLVVDIITYNKDDKISVIRAYKQ